MVSFAKWIIHQTYKHNWLEIAMNMEYEKTRNTRTKAWAVSISHLQNSVVG